MFESSRPVSGPPPLPPRTASHVATSAPPLPPRPPSTTVTPTTQLLSNRHESLPGGYGTMSEAQRSRVRSIQRDLDETAEIAHDTIANMLERGEALRDIEKRAVTLLVSGEVFQRNSQNHTQERQTSLRWQRSLFGCALCCVLFVIVCFLFWLRRQPF
ncbi:hypothetical protein BCR44DRAFT_1437214 [Catenaria anguillulae PL171]|uniref:V-SNARE coiled-coil homology domain-containing protein n=1 Tax=Catenaria anguillulae PL171 TaxID=765915 RepID=A0A1Y2HH10_9FUNG|nr:hypothetical protein BCR44DRAFT_1437214 [Catenaria anguillulae PL171]